MPVFSIIIPAYNSERFIGDTLSMLVSQGLDGGEVIVINDGSTDRTGEICREFADRHSAIRLINIRNSGVSVARNTGLSDAKGDYVYFLDSDDTLAPDTLKFFLENVRIHDADIMAFGYKTRFNRKIIKEYQYKKYSGLIFDADMFLRLFLKKKMYCHLSSMVFSKKTLRENKFTPGLKIGEDVEFICRVLSCARSVYYDARLCFIYQLRNDSVSQGYKSISMEQCNVVLVLSNCFGEIFNGRITGEARLYLANLYVLLLFRYLKSKPKSYAINHFFNENRHFLHGEISGNPFRLLIIKLAKIIPLNFLFYIFRKNGRQ